MLLTGNQLKAARALAEVEQQQLADVAGVHVNTIRKMEAKGAGLITSAADVLRKVQAAMESFGVVFINGGEPGVKLASTAPASNGKAVRKRATRKPSDDMALPAYAAA
jgi:transcriptional regulator with XRE-family HTH domain